MDSIAVDFRETPPEECRGGAISFGNFDGVHRGHAALLSQLGRQAKELGCSAVAVTFDPPPLRLLHPELFQPVLTTLPERIRLLRECGATHVLILRTTHELLQLSAREFFHEVVCGRLQTRGLVEGENFGFGRNREGNVGLLRDFCTDAGIPLAIVPPQIAGDGGVISSSRVRHALLLGRVEEVIGLLGRPYLLTGEVARGQRRGQTLGFPTANLERVATLIPVDGVYAVRAGVGQQVWPGAANIGPNPTFGEQARKVEVHLIGYRGDLYGQSLRVEFLARLRDTRPFAGPAELVEQLHRDVADARRVADAS